MNSNVVAKFGENQLLGTWEVAKMAFIQNFQKNHSYGPKSSEHTGPIALKSSQMLSLN